MCRCGQRAETDLPKVFILLIVYQKLQVFCYLMHGTVSLDPPRRRRRCRGLRAPIRGFGLVVLREAEEEDAPSNGVTLQLLESDRGRFRPRVVDKCTPSLVEHTN